MSSIQSAVQSFTNSLFGAAITGSHALSKVPQIQSQQLTREAGNLYKAWESTKDQKLSDEIYDKIRDKELEAYALNPENKKLQERASGIRDERSEEVDWEKKQTLKREKEERSAQIRRSILANDDEYNKMIRTPDYQDYVISIGGRDYRLGGDE